jgi:hypothetical protein
MPRGSMPLAHARSGRIVRGMKHYDEPTHFCSAAGTLPPDRVRLAAFAYLARFTGSSREHIESDLR